MRQDILKRAEQYREQKRRRQRFYRWVSALSCLVLLCTVSALVLPATTEEKYICGLEEHTHTSDCYEQQTVETISFSCLDKLHTHEAVCYDTEGNLTCGTSDFYIHAHNEDCYDADGNLICPLKEVEAHTHSDGCYTDGVVTCGQSQVILHEEHDTSCYDEDGALTCALPIQLAHTHTEDCRVTEQGVTTGLTCLLEEHTHSEECETAEEEETDYVTMWNGMSDEDFAAWVMNDENKALILELYQAEDDSLFSDLCIRMSEIEDNDETLYSQVYSYLQELLLSGDYGTETYADPTAIKLTADNVANYITYSSNSTGSYFYLSGGTYYLDDNIDLSKVKKNNQTVTYLRLSNRANVTLDLNGYVLKGSGTASVITVTKDCSLTINDSVKTRSHYGTVSNYIWTWNEDDTNTSGTEIKGGIITGGGGADSDKMNYNNSAIYVASGGTLTFNAGTVAGNVQYCTASEGKYGGAGINCYGTLTMNGGRVCYNYSYHNGGGIFASGSATIENVEIDHNYAANYGGGVRVATQYNTSFTMTNCTIHDNVAGKDGGGIEFSQGHDGTDSKATEIIKAEFDNVQIYSNSAAENGGGISMSEKSNYGASLTIKDTDTLKLSSIYNNTAGQKGGGVYLEYGTINFETGTITRNSAAEGGGVYLKADSTDTNYAMCKLDIQGGSITHNLAGAQYNSMTITDYTYTVSSQNGDGGGFYVESGSFSMSSGDIADNTSTQHGGGGYVTGGTIEVSGGTIQSNHAGVIESNGAIMTKGSGGGFYVESGTFTMTGGTIQNNQASLDGGGGYVSGGTVDLQGGTFSENIAQVNGGGLSVIGTNTALATVSAGDPLTAASDNTDTTSNEDNIKKKIAEYEGSITFDSNQATTGNGGGIYLLYAYFTMSSANVKNNTAVNWETLDDLNYGNGGGIYAKNSVFSMQGGVVQGNSATRFGGGVYVWVEDAERSSPNIMYSNSISGGYVYNNKAAQCGGGIAVYQCELDVTGGQILYNYSVQGGGIYLRWGAILDMDGGSISYNHAHKMLETSEHKHDDELFDTFANYYYGNETEGIKKTYTSLDFQEANTTGNTDSGGNGGGVFIYNSTMDLSNGTISNNTAGRNGGGVYAVHSQGTKSHLTSDYATTMNFNGGEIINNTAEKRGGAVSMATYDWKYEENADKTLNLEDGVKSDGCQYKSSDDACSVTFLSKAVVYNNEAEDGGGFYVGGGLLNIEGGYIYGNSATATEEEIKAAGLTTAIDPNVNIGVGGGIYVYYAGTLKMSPNNTMGIYSNTASFAADDIYCSGGSSSEIALPNVEDMDLVDYANHRVGKAIGWFEDYANGDTQYEEREDDGSDLKYYLNNGTTTTVSDELENGSPLIIRYRTALANRVANELSKNVVSVAALALDDEEEDTSTETSGLLNQRMVEFVIEKDGTAEVNEYIALTIGYSATRYNLTVSKIVDNTTGEASSTIGPFSFTVEIEGAVDYLDLKFNEGTKHVYDSSAYTITNDIVDSWKDDGTLDAAGYATVTFTLNAGESVELKGIPVGAKVTVTENDSGNYATYYRSYDGTIVSNTTTMVIDEMTETTSVTCVNAIGYALPETGGSGTLIYTISGVLLTASAVVYWIRRRRRAR